MRKIRIPWSVWPLFIVASIPAALDVWAFIIGLTPKEIFGADWSAAEYSLLSFGRFNLWHMLSMIILEFTLIQACLNRAYRRDRAQSPWVLLTYSLIKRQMLMTQKQWWDLFRENLLQKISWLGAAFIVVYLSRINRNPALLYGGLIALCGTMAALWTSNLFWRHKDSTKHYVRQGAISFITVAALAWNFGFEAAVWMYVTVEVLLFALLKIAIWVVKPEPEEPVDETAPKPKTLRVVLKFLIDESGSMLDNGKDVCMRKCLAMLKDKLIDLLSADLLLLIRIGFGDCVSKHARLCLVEDFDTSYNPNGGSTALNDAYIYGCSSTPEEDTIEIVVGLTDGEDSGHGASTNQVRTAVENYIERGGIVAYINFGANPKTPESFGIDPKNVRSVMGCSEQELNYLFDELLKGILATVEDAAVGRRRETFFVS